MRALCCIAIVCLASSAASADGAGDRVARGEELAKQQRLTEAIEAFKAADKLEKRAKHACLIALAYIRRELWPQAEIFLTMCHERANASDPVPDWVPLAEQQLKERLLKAKVAAVEIQVAPDSVASRAQIAVSSFEPDELFAPRTVHLTRGKHLITATADGHKPAQQTIEITDDSPREVLIDFDRKDSGGVIPTTPNPSKPKPAPAPGPSKIPLVVMATGGAIMLAGVAVHVLQLKPAREDLDAASAAEYSSFEPAFDSALKKTIALYSVGAATIAVGLVLRYTVFKGKPESAPMTSIVRISPTGGGAVVTFGWSR